MGGGGCGEGQNLLYNLLGVVYLTSGGHLRELWCLILKKCLSDILPRESSSSRDKVIIILDLALRLRLPRSLQ